ncbi:MAG: fumarylacetoacetate hydrolase family protein [Pseudomonadota bacterium]
MTNFAIPAPPTPSLPLEGEEARFPIRRIFCVGRNYAAHAREFGNDPDRDPPFFFTKPADAAFCPEEIGGDAPFPPMTENLHHEVELVVAVGAGGRDIAPEAALDHVFGYGVGVDMTRRDLQDVAKKMSRPWDWSKAFDASAPISTLRRARDIGHPATGAIGIAVNGETRQAADIADMIWPIPDVIAYLSRAMTIAPGDLIMTGTPAGVSQLVRGDKVAGHVSGVGEIGFRMV